jgi:hypothetical protein
MLMENGMRRRRSMLTRLALALAAVALTSVAVVSSASAEAVTVKKAWYPGFAAPETPERLNKVGVIKVVPMKEGGAKNVLVLEPGTSAGAGYFVPLATWVVESTTGWQVWAVERRENRLENQSELNKAKKGEVTPEALFNYYLGYLTKPGVKPHLNPLTEASAIADGARQWGMNVAVEDLHVPSATSCRSWKGCRQKQVSVTGGTDTQRCGMTPRRAGPLRSALRASLPA